MTVAKNDPWLKENPIDQIEGANVAIAYTVVFEGITTVTVNEISVWKDSTNVTATVMPGGSHVASGNRLTMKPLTLLTYPGDYVILMEVDVDGQDDAWQLKIRAKERGGIA